MISPDQAEAYRQQRAVQQAEIVTGLQRVLERATQIDSTLADALTRTTTTLTDARTALVAATGRPVPEPPGSGGPQANTDWWNQLTPAERDQVLTQHPEWVGNRDGIPATIRDQANRVLLQREYDRIDRDLTDATARWQAGFDQAETREQNQLRERVEVLQTKRDALEAIRDTLGRGDR